MKKKFKKVTIALIVLLMVIAGTLAWLVTSDFKKGKIGAANFTLDVEAVRPIEESDFDDEDFVRSSDGFTLNDGEVQMQNAIEDEESTTNIFHYSDSDMYPISKTNINAIYDEDKVATKYIRITNNNDSDAIVELSADTLDTAKADSVSWLVGAPAGWDSYMGVTSAADVVVEAPAAEASLANILNNKAADVDTNDLIDEDYFWDYQWIKDNNDDYVDNDFFYLVGIGYSKDIRDVAWALDFDENDNPIGVHPLIAYDNYDEDADVNSLMQRNVVYVEDGRSIAGIASDKEKLLLTDMHSSINEQKALANILKEGDQLDGQEGGDGSGDGSGTQVPAAEVPEKTEDPANQSTGNDQAPNFELSEKLDDSWYLANDIEGKYVHQTFEDASSTGFALPFVLRAHTSVVIPFKVFLNENWDDIEGNFEYNINVKARNYTDGDDITFQAEKKEAEEDDVAALATKLTALAETLAKNNIWDLKLSGDAKVFSDFDSSADFNKYILAAVDKGDLTATEIKNMISAVIDEYAYEVHKANQNGLNGENYTGEYSSLLISALSEIDNKATLTNVVYGKRDYSQYTETQLRLLMRNILNCLDAKADKLVSSEYMNSQFLRIYNFKTGEFYAADKLTNLPDALGGEFTTGEITKTND